MRTNIRLRIGEREITDPVVLSLFAAVACTVLIVLAPLLLAVSVVLAGMGRRGFVYHDGDSWCAGLDGGAFGRRGGNE